MTATFEQITEIAVPQGTRSYMPVSNQVLVEGIRAQLTEEGLHIVEERFELAGGSKENKGQQMFGTMVVEPKKDINITKQGSGSTYGTTTTEMQRVMGFRNSYDKSLPIGLVAGANVIVCSNLQFGGRIMKIRKHTSNIFYELDNLVFDCVKAIEREFNTIVQQTERLKLVKIDKTQAAELCGIMFMQEGIITSTQLNIIKREWDSKVPDGTQTGWELMNHFTTALKTSPPRTRMEDQLKINSYLNKALVEEV